MLVIFHLPFQIHCSLASLLCLRPKRLICLDSSTGSLALLFPVGLNEWRAPRKKNQRNKGGRGWCVSPWAPSLQTGLGLAAWLLYPMLQSLPGGFFHTTPFPHLCRPKSGVAPQCRIISVAPSHETTPL